MLKILMTASIFIAVCSCSKENGEALRRSIYTQFALDYFKLRKVQNVLLFLCWPKVDLVKAVASFSDNHMMVAVPGSKYARTRRNADRLFGVNAPQRTGAVFDRCCYEARTPASLQMFDGHFDASYAWLALDCDPDRSLDDRLAALPLSAATDLTVAVATSASSLDLYDAHRTGVAGDGGRLRARHVGAWTPFAESISEAAPWRASLAAPRATSRTDLGGVRVRAVTFAEHNDRAVDTHEYLADESRPYVDTTFRMNYQLVRLLAERNNFTIKFVLANNWSDKNSKGSYQSENLLGILADKKAEILVGSLLYKTETASIAEPLYFTYPTRSGFIFRYMGQFGNVRMNFDSPFHKYVWLSFAATVILMISTTWLIVVLERKYLNNMFRWSLSDAILSFVGGCCQMGSDFFPWASSSRAAYSIFLFSSLVLYNYYTSSIVSNLLSFRKQQFTLIDLADSPLKCGSLDVGFVHNLLFDIPLYPNMKYFNSKKLTKDFYHPIEKGIEMVRRGDFAYHAEFINMYHLIEILFENNEICELEEVDTIPLTKSAIMGMKNSPYNELFKIGLIKMDETGQVKRTQLKWVSRKPICQSGKSFTVVGVNQIASSFTLLYIGMGLSVALLVFELDKWRLIKKVCFIR